LFRRKTSIFKEKKMRKLVSVIAALAMVATFAMSAAAADWNFYGSARIETFFESADVSGGNDTDDFSLVDPGNSRIGSNVAVSDELSGRFEYGTGGGNASIRLLYAKWNFGGGTLTVGQDYTPIANGSGYSQQFKNGNTGMIGYGMPYSGRHPQLKLSFGDFHIAAIRNIDLEEGVQADVAAAATTDAYTLLGETAATATNAQRVAAETAGAGYAANITAETKLPRVEARYFYDVGPVRLRAAGGYATVDFTDNNPGANWSEDFDAYFVGFGLQFTSGPFYAGANYGMGENLSVLGIATTTTALPDVNTNTGAVTDAETDMYYILAGFRFNEMAAAEIGWGKEQTEIGADKVDVTSYYLTVPITLAPGVTIRPEVGRFDTEEVNNTETTYYGLTWQINF
jgi:hypothetical protein